MPGRSFVAGSGYRFGFQNQEMESELFQGAIYFTYRIEDSRIGRFLTIDPLSNEYPFNSPYAFSENRLMDSRELEGLEKVDVNSYTPPFVGAGIRIYNLFNSNTAYNRTVGGLVHASEATMNNASDNYQYQTQTGNYNPIVPEQIREINHTFTDIQSKSEIIGGVAKFANTVLTIQSALELAPTSAFSSMDNSMKIGFSNYKLSSTASKETYLFRFDTRTPDEIYSQGGFIAKGNEYNLQSHVFENTSNSGYISTTQNPTFARTELGSGYVYTIRNNGLGINVNSVIPDNKFSYEMEVAFRDKIPNSEIKGARYVSKAKFTGDFNSNPNFKINCNVSDW